MKKHIFPYAFKLSFEGKRVSTFPAINMGLIKEDSKEEFSFLVLVDSGAEISLFTKGDADLLGIDINKGKRIDIGSIGGERTLAFLHNIIIKIGDEKLKIKAAFSKRNDIPRILGRNPIFSYFFVIFDENKKNTIFISRENREFEKIIY